jgi:hypothetical protein
MKGKIVKAGLFCAACFCLAAVFLFADRKTATATGTDNFSPVIETESRAETRCGWVINPTPANWWLNDADGEWTIGVQGGYQASGADLPDFGKQWVVTNGSSYGYGCACMNVTTNKKEMKVSTIKSVKVRPLSACRKDKKLKEPKD